MKRLTFGVCLLTMLCIAAQTFADPVTITITKETAPAGDTENVLFSSGITTSPFVGEIQNTGFFFKFTVADDFITGASGQAFFEATGDSLDHVVMEMDDPLGAFTKLTFNLIGSGSVKVSALGWDGNLVEEEFSGGLTPGQNFFLTLSSPELIRQVTIETYNGGIIDSVRQVRVGGAQIIPLPLAAWGGLALFGVMGVGHRLRNRKA